MKALLGIHDGTNAESGAVRAEWHDLSQADLELTADVRMTGQPFHCNALERD